MVAIVKVATIAVRNLSMLKIRMVSMRLSEQHVQQTILNIKRKFGKNAVIKGMDMFADATGQQRNRQIGGHAA